MNIIINGKTVAVKRWDTVLTAASRAGIRIPSLCHHPALGPAGVCRLCMVEVRQQGAQKRKMVSACEFPVSEGLEVVTSSMEILKSRRTTIDLLLARSPGSALLQRLSEETGLEPTNYPAPEGSSACVLCGLCTRACDKMGLSAISMVGRGQGRSVSPPFAQAPEACVGCGSCANICPVDFIEMDDSPDGRSIWGRRFDWVNCVDCGASFITKAFAEHARRVRNLDETYFERCPSCKRKLHTVRFAGVGKPNGGDYE